MRIMAGNITENKQKQSIKISSVISTLKPWAPDIRISNYLGIIFCHKISEGALTWEGSWWMIVIRRQDIFPWNNHHHMTSQKKSLLKNWHELQLLGNEISFSHQHDDHDMRNLLTSSEIFFDDEDNDGIPSSHHLILSSSISWNSHNFWRHMPCTTFIVMMIKMMMMREGK